MRETGWERKTKLSVALQRASGLRARLLYSSGREGRYYARYGNKRGLLLIGSRKECTEAIFMCGVSFEMPNQLSRAQLSPGPQLLSLS